LFCLQWRLHMGGNVFDLKSPDKGNGDPDRIEHQLVFKIPI